MIISGAGRSSTSSDDVTDADRHDDVTVEAPTTCRWRADVRLIRRLFRCATFVVITVIHAATTMAAASADAPPSEGARLRSSGATLVTGYFQRQSQKLQLGVGVRGRINCPAEPDPPTTLIVWMKDGAGVIDTGDDGGGGGGGSLAAPTKIERTPPGSRWGETLNRPSASVKATVPTAASATMTTSAPLKQQRDARLTIDEVTGALIVDPVTAADSGTYRCMAYSPLDNSRTTYQITVNVKGNDDQRTDRYRRRRSLLWY
jgi:hypothetical protein